MSLDKDLIWEYFSNAAALKNILISILFFFLATLAKVALIKKIQSNKSLSSVDSILLIRNVKNYTNFFLAVGLIILWFTQIHSVFVSLVAVTAALVLATKEIIMSIMGGLLVRVNNHFSIGDRIEVNGIRGFVIQKNLTVTKVLEIGPEKNSQQTTGDIITIPNGIMLSNSVRNESYFKNFSVKSFTLKVPNSMSFDKFEALALEWAKEITKDYIKEARKLIEDFCSKEGIVIPDVNPRSKVILGLDDNFELLLKMPVPNNKIGDIEQKLYRQYLKVIEEERTKVINEDLPIRS